MIKQIIPNPFNASTEVWMELTEPGTVNLVMYNLIGQEMGNVSRYYHNAGLYSIILDLSSLSKGVYMVSVKLNGKEEGKAKAIKLN